MPVGYLLRRFLYPLSILLLLGSCAKKTEPTPTSPTPAPAPANGSISGQITPANSVALVTATKAGGQPVTVVPSAAGGYSFTSLAAGDYTLSFAVAAGYVAPANVAVTLAQSQNLVAPAITISDTKTAWLVARSWRVTAYTVERTSTTPTNPYLFTDVYAQMAACERDDFFRFTLPNVVTTDEGTTKCSASAPQTVAGQWAFDATKTRLILPYGINPPPGFVIVYFDANTFQLRDIDRPTPTVTFTTDITLTAF